MENVDLKNENPTFDNVLLVAGASEKPTMEFYGWTNTCAAGTIAMNNWQIEGGEEEYYKALKIWEDAQSTCH